MARFPTPDRLALPSSPETFVSLVDELIGKGRLSDGYVRATAADRELFLFFVKGKVHAAGELEGDRPGARSVVDFFMALPKARSVHAVTGDTGLVLCLSALFRKAPSAQIPLTLLNGGEFLAAIRKTGRNAVLAVRSGDARSLVFCQSGEPVALYPAEGEVFPSGQTVADQVVDYSLHAKFVALDVYEDIRMPATGDAGLPLAHYVAAARRGLTATGTAVIPAAAIPAVLVRLGDRVVFQAPVVKDVLHVGRGSACDIVLDNLSVSRKHAMLVRAGRRLAVVDLQSENGLVYKGAKVARAELAPGEEITIGKYTLVWPMHAPGSEIPIAGPFSGQKSDEDETVFMSRNARESAMLVHGDRALALKAAATTIGSDPKGDLVLTGFFIAPVHARVVREKNGQHRLRHVAGLRSVRVNGAATKDALLANGDVIQLARHEIRVLLVR